MATVFQRVRFFCKTKKIFLLPQRDRNEIGKLVAATFRSQNEEMPQKWLKIKEPEGTFNVQWYPTEFIPEIDKIIRIFFANNSISKVAKPENVPRLTLETIPEPVELKPKRKRIPIKSQPVKVN